MPPGLSSSSGVRSRRVKCARDEVPGEETGGQTMDTMRPEIRRGLDAREYESVERCFITETANDSGDETASIARARVRPNTTTAWHRLAGITERYIVCSGRGLVEIGDLEPTDVGEGDIVRIPPGVRQRITNTGESDLVLYCVCTPRFDDRYYENLE